MQAIATLPPTESATDSSLAAAKRPWQTPTCTKFTAKELTEMIGLPLIIDGGSSRGS